MQDHKWVPSGDPDGEVEECSTCGALDVNLYSPLSPSCPGHRLSQFSRYRMHVLDKLLHDMDMRELGLGREPHARA